MNLGFFRRDKKQPQSQSQQQLQAASLKATASLKSNPSDEVLANHPSDAVDIDGGFTERAEGPESHAAAGDKIVVATAPPSFHGSRDANANDDAS
jgi:hypothetical protein